MCVTISEILRNDQPRYGLEAKGRVAYLLQTRSYQCQGLSIDEDDDALCDDSAGELVESKKNEKRGYFESETAWMWVLFLLPVAMSLLVGFVGMMFRGLRHAMVWFGT